MIELNEENALTSFCQRVFYLIVPSLKKHFPFSN